MEQVSEVILSLLALYQLSYTKLSLVPSVLLVVVGPGPDD